VGRTGSGDCRCEAEGEGSKGASVRLEAGSGGLGSATDEPGVVAHRGEGSGRAVASDFATRPRLGVSHFDCCWAYFPQPTSRGKFPFIHSIHVPRTSTEGAAVLKIWVSPNGGLVPPQAT
jgi:hypothetical protein